MNRGGRRRPRLGKSLTRPLQGTPARPEARGRRGRRRGSSGTSAARRTVVGATPTRLRRRSRSGEGRARERESGRDGEGSWWRLVGRRPRRRGEGSVEAGALAILSPPQRRRGGSGGDARLFRPWSGEQGRGESDRGGGTGRFGGWARWAGLAASWAVWSRGVIFFSFCFTLSYFSFSVLANCLGTK